MTENPYQSPKAAGDRKVREQDIDPQWRGFAGRRHRRAILLDRPMGVTIACVANVIVTVAAMVFFMCLDSARFMAFQGPHELCPGVFLVNFFAIGAIAVVIAFGMWDAKWSWWAMTFLQMYCFLDTIVGDVVLRLAVGFQSKPFSPQAAMYVTRGVVYSALWILYFYTDDVLAFFQQPQNRKLLTGTCIFLAASVVTAIEISLEIALRTIDR